MALRTSTVPDDIVFALVAAHNQAKVDGIGSFFHLSQTESTGRANYQKPTVTRLRIASANATDLPTSITLLNELKVAFNVHIADAIAHQTIVTTALATADASDLTTAEALANAIKAAFNTHLTAASEHYTNDGTNTNATAAATDQATTNALANALKGNFNAHFASAPQGTYIDARP